MWPYYCLMGTSNVVGKLRYFSFSACYYIFLSQKPAGRVWTSHQTRAIFWPQNRSKTCFCPKWPIAGLIYTIISVRKLLTKILLSIILYGWCLARLNVAILLFIGHIQRCRKIAILLIFCLSLYLSIIHIWRCRRIERCRSRWSPYH